MLRDSFEDRSDLLKEKGDFIEEYPCFTEAEYFIYEFSILIGRTALQTLQEKMKTFFERNATEEDWKSESAFLDVWIRFEKKTAASHTTEKTKPIIEVIEDIALFSERIKKDAVYPCGYALLQNKKVKDIVAKYRSHTILCEKPDVPFFLTLLLSLYYTMELHYPKMYMQAMGVLAYYLLNDKYYKLGARATRVITQLYRVE